MIRRLAGVASIWGWLVVAIGAAVLLIGATTVTAAQPTLDWGTQLSADQCGAGKMVINVTYQVVNDVDSGTGGNNWAFDDYVRQIQVRETGAGTYCAVVRYKGSFTTIAGTSPGSTGTVSDGITGTFEGGYRATITGALASSPLWPTRSSLGTVDYDCDPSGDCPGYVSWVATFFSSGASFSYDWWGWIYHAGAHGTWVNSLVNAGDITD